MMSLLFAPFAHRDQSALERYRNSQGDMKRDMNMQVISRHHFTKIKRYFHVTDTTKFNFLDKKWKIRLLVAEIKPRS